MPDLDRVYRLRLYNRQVKLGSTLLTNDISSLSSPTLSHLELSMPNEPNEEQQYRQQMLVVTKIKIKIMDHLMTLNSKVIPVVLWKLTVLLDLSKGLMVSPEL